MEFTYSIGGVEVSLQEIHRETGYRQGEPRLFAIRNCEWSAELAVLESWNVTTPGVEVTPRFLSGNHAKFQDDVGYIVSLVRLCAAAPGGHVALRYSQDR